MMELDEAIKHCEDKAKELRKEKRIMAAIGREQEWADCLRCAEEHEQLAEWLTDYKRLKALEERPTGEWIPVKYHEITDKERTEEEYPEEWVYFLDCPMPEDGQRILVQTNYQIELDECYFDDGYTLDSGHDWRDIIAWMPLPEPYKEGEEE